MFVFLKCRVGNENCCAAPDFMCFSLRWFYYDNCNLDLLLDFANDIIVKTFQKPFIACSWDKCLSQELIVQVQFPIMKNSNLSQPIPFAIDEIHGSLNERLEKVIENLPEGHLAYHDPHSDVSYAQLFENGKRLAAALAIDLGSDAQHEQQMVALLLDADWTELLGLMGVVLAGHYYVAFDPLQGMAQPQAYFAEYPIRALMTSLRYADVVRNLIQFAPHEIKILFVDDIPDVPKEYQIPILDADSYHSVYFTSGSTGKPRGVLRTHGVILHSAYISSVDLGFVPCDRITLTMPVSLGMSLTSTLGALLNGVTIYRRTEALANPLAFYRWLQEDCISIARASAGLVRSLLNLPEEFGVIESLRLVDTGGEAFKRREIERVLAFMLPGGKLNIRLASNEAGNYAMFRVQAGQAWDGETNPAGFPPKLVDVLVVDENRQPLAAGQKGELAIRSRYLAAGYINDPVQTATRFEIVADGSGDRLYYTGDMGRILPDGSVEFLGRKDFRVKVRGYTIELEAVEKALKNLPNVRNAATTVQTLPSGNKRLVGFLVLEAEHEIHLEQVRKQLGADLPNYMIPSILQVIESIPLTPTGKPDRKALPVPTSQRPALDVPYRAPQTDSEVELVRIWESVLGIQTVGIDDSFFELGGDSLMSMQMIMEVEKYFDAAVPQQFFKLPTIASLAQLLQPVTNSDPTAWLESGTSRQNKYQIQTKLQYFGQRWAHFTHDRITLDRIFNTSVRQFRRLIEARMLSQSYGDGLQWLMDWAGRPMTQNMLYAREKEIFSAFFGDVRQNSLNAPETFLMALAGNILASHAPELKHGDEEKGQLSRYTDSPYLFWRTFAPIIAQPESNFAQKFLTISGLENLQAAHGRGRGLIVLAYHGTMARLPSLLMPQWLGKPAALVLSPRVSMRVDSGPRRQMRHEVASLEGAKQARYGSDVMVQGYRALQAGEVVVAFVDNGFTSRGEWPLDVCGRQYLTRSGWADLASHTGAQVVPVISTLLTGGRSSVRFLEPFSSLETHFDHETRVQNYMSQFAEYLSSAFTHFPESLRWKIMQNHLETSRIGEPTQGPGQ